MTGIRNRMIIQNLTTTAAVMWAQSIWHVHIERKHVSLAKDEI